MEKLYSPILGWSGVTAIAIGIALTIKGEWLIAPPVFLIAFALLMAWLFQQKDT